MKHYSLRLDVPSGTTSVILSQRSSRGTTSNPPSAKFARDSSRNDNLQTLRRIGDLPGFLDSFPAGNCESGIRIGRDKVTLIKATRLLDVRTGKLLIDQTILVDGNKIVPVTSSSDSAQLALVPVESLI